MKKIKSCICLILVCAFFMASATLASARASEQIDIYDIFCHWNFYHESSGRREYLYLREQCW